MHPTSSCMPVRTFQASTLTELGRRRCESLHVGSPTPRPCCPPPCCPACPCPACCAPPLLPRRALLRSRALRPAPPSRSGGVDRSAASRRAKPPTHGCTYCMYRLSEARACRVATRWALRRGVGVAASKENRAPHCRRAALRLGVIRHYLLYCSEAVAGARRPPARYTAMAADEIQLAVYRTTASRQIGRRW